MLLVISLKASNCSLLQCYHKSLNIKLKEPQKLIPALYLGNSPYKIKTPLLKEQVFFERSHQWVFTEKFLSGACYVELFISLIKFMWASFSQFMAFICGILAILQFYRNQAQPSIIIQGSLLIVRTFMGIVYGIFIKDLLNHSLKRIPTIIIIGHIIWISSVMVEYHHGLPVYLF